MDSYTGAPGEDRSELVEANGGVTCGEGHRTYDVGVKMTKQRPWAMILVERTALTA